jgi:hypothetical protein
MDKAELRMILDKAFGGDAERRRREEALKRREWRRTVLGGVPGRAEQARGKARDAAPEDEAALAVAPAAERRAKAEAAVEARVRSEISDTYQALCSLIKEAGLSAKIIPGLLAALSAAGGHGPDEFFRQTDEQLGRRMGRGGPGAQGFARRWSRAWRLLDSEQRRAGLTLVERRRGGRDPLTQRKLRSEYRVPLVQFIVDLKASAGRLRGRGLKRHERFELAARQLVASLPRDYTYRDGT